MPRTRLLCSIGLAIVLASSVAAAADDDPPPPAPAAPRSAPAPYDGGEPRGAPPAYAYTPLPPPPPLGRRGFQAAVRSGLAFPLGSFKAHDDVGLPGGRAEARDLVGPQLALAADVGAKITKWIFLGGYVGFAAGLPAGDLAASCDTMRLDCRSLSFRIGAQILYAIAPDARLDPWFGYGLGYSSLTVGDDGVDVTYRGFDFGRFSAGLDVRISRTIGLGPFAELTVGKYASRRVETSSAEAASDIVGRTFHYWMTIGPRLVFMP